MREDINRYNAERALEALEDALLRRMVRTPGAIVVPRQHEAVEWLEDIVANPPRDRYISPADYLEKGIDITDEHQFSL
jgi:hypothetical protein